MIAEVDIDGDGRIDYDGNITYDVCDIIMLLIKVVTRSCKSACLLVS